MSSTSNVAPRSTIVNVVADLLDVKTLNKITLPVQLDTINTPTQSPLSTEQIVMTPLTMPSTQQIYTPNTTESEQNNEFDSVLEKFKKQILYTVEQSMEVMKQRQIKTAFLQMKAADISDAAILCNAVNNNDIEFLKFLFSDKSIKNRIDIDDYDDNGKCALHYAVKKGDTELVEFLFSQGANPNIIEKNGDKSAPLHMAVVNQDYDMVQCLITTCKAMVDIEQNNENRCTPLHLAAEKGLPKISQLLLNNNACVNQVNMKDNMTPIHIAVFHNNERTTVFLLGRGADLSICNTSGDSPLVTAQKKDFKNIIAILNDHLKTNKPPVQTNQKISHQDLLKPFKSKTQDSIDLIEAAKEGHLHKVIGLVQRGADVNFLNGNTSPLHWAASKQFNKIVEFLLDNGAEVNLKDECNGYTPLHYSSSNGFLEITQMLLQKNASPNEYCKREPSTPLLFAVNNDREEIVKVIMANGGNPNVMNMKGETPYTIAKQKNLTAIVKIFEPHVSDKYVHGKSIDDFLQPFKYHSDDYNHLREAVEKGHLLQVIGYTKRLVAANQKSLLNTLNWQIKIPLLHLAISKGFNSIALFLVNQGIRINLLDNAFDFSPLHYSVWNDNLEMIQLLVRKKVKLNKPVKVNCKTPLHLAAEKNHPKSLQLLLESGADPRIINREGETAYAIAKKNNFVDCMKLLEEHFSKMPQNIALFDVSDSIDPATDDSQNNPIWFKNAVSNGKWGDVVKYVKCKKSLTKAVTNKKMLKADQNNYVKIVLFLLENDVKISTNEYGEITPLHYAAIRNLPFEFKRLLDAGANPYKKTGGLFTIKSEDKFLKKNCKSVREIAQAKQHDEILQILDEYEEAKVREEKELQISKVNEKLNEDEIPLLDATSEPKFPSLEPFYYRTVKE